MSQRCYWCIYKVDMHNLLPGETPFSLDLPHGLKGFWCNGSCCASFVKKHRTHMSEWGYTSAIHDALHHRSSVRYRFAPEPFQFAWFRDEVDPLQREEFLSLCTYYDTETRTEVTRNVARPVTYNLLDALQLVAPDPIPMITLKRRREDQPQHDPDGNAQPQVHVVAEMSSPRDAIDKKRKSKLSINKKQ